MRHTYTSIEVRFFIATQKAIEIVCKIRTARSYKHYYSAVKSVCDRVAKELRVKKRKLYGRIMFVLAGRKIPAIVPSNYGVNMRSRRRCFNRIPRKVVPRPVRVWVEREKREFVPRASLHQEGDIDGESDIFRPSEDEFRRGYDNKRSPFFST